MEIIQDWALSVCMACICVGVLQQFTTNKTNFSVIKLVLSLYILITAFAPLGNTSEINADFTYNLPEVSDAALNTDDLILQAAHHNINETLFKAVQATSENVQSVNAAVHVTDNYMYVTSVEITLAEETVQSTDTQKVKQAVLSALQTDVPVVIIGG